MAAEPEKKVHATMFAVPESFWQAELQGQKLQAAALRQRLVEECRLGRAEQILDVQNSLKDDQPSEWRSGEDTKFVSGWQTDRNQPHATPHTTVTRFVGTRLAMTLCGLEEDGRSEVALKLDHHTAEPTMRLFNYANAATGQEREKLSVEYPQFTQVNWTGHVLAGPEWRLAAQILHRPSGEAANSNEPRAKRYFLFVQQPSSVSQTPLTASAQARQVVIRVPEMQVATLMAEPGQNSDETLYAALLREVQAGRAQIISDLTSAVQHGEHINVRQGNSFWLPSELNQDTDRLYLTPSSHEEYFAGAAMDVQARMRDLGDLRKGGGADWLAICSPRGPVVSRWPTSWLNIYTADFKPDPQNRLVRGWLDFHDVFTEQALSSLEFQDPGMHLLAMMPPGDQVWPGRAAGRQVDVFFAQIKPDNLEVPHPLNDDSKQKNADDEARADRTFIWGISLESSEAALLMVGRQPENDALLLQHLLERVKKGGAQLQLCAGLVGQPGSRHRLDSGREHQVPTEMPSIPSAWSSRLVGTSLEIDGGSFSLQHHLGIPRRSEWRLALDDPQAVMWQPRFRSLNVSGMFGGNGTRLLSVLRIPNLMSGEGVPKGETLVLFARRDGTPVAGNATTASMLEAELLVLELPAAEEDGFKSVPGEPFAKVAENRLPHLLERLKSGEVRVAGHALLNLRDNRASARVAEEFMHATEFDPPDIKGVRRMRPTALETEFGGDLLEIETYVPDPTRPEIDVRLNFQHSNAAPVEPSLETALAVAAKDETMKDFPQPVHPRETWSPAEALRVMPGEVVCLGVRKPSGIQRKVVQVAYLTVREIP